MRRVLAPAVCLLAFSAVTQAQTVCGFVATIPQPPASRELYPVAIAEVDGKKVEGREARRIKLAIGPHLIGIREQIADERRGRAKLEELGLGKGATALKVIDIDVQADGSYLLAAELIEDSKARQQPSDYWQPVVWRKLVDSCR